VFKLLRLNQNTLEIQSTRDDRISCQIVLEVLGIAYFSTGRHPRSCSRFANARSPAMYFSRAGFNSIAAFHLSAVVCEIMSPAGKSFNLNRIDYNSGCVDLFFSDEAG